MAGLTQLASSSATSGYVAQGASRSRTPPDGLAFSSGIAALDHIDVTTTSRGHDGDPDRIHTPSSRMLVSLQNRG